MHERYTVTPKQFQWIALLALGALAAIVITGAGVRLTGSGLGCPDWPRCYGKVLPPLQTHALIEFGNRAISGLVGIATIGVFVAAFRLRPYRRSLVILSALLPVGVLAQAVLGGLTVEGKLDYGYVMAHFSLSFVILAAAVTLLWAARQEPSDTPIEPVHERRVVLAVRSLLFLAGLTIVAGTAATAAGPHAGGSPGQHINRLDFDGTGTMDFVIHRHGEIGCVFGLGLVALWYWMQHAEVGGELNRVITGLCLLMACQGFVGIVQYELKLPTELVEVHVAMSAFIWIGALWATAVAGRLAPRSTAAGERALAPEPHIAP